MTDYPCVRSWQPHSNRHNPQGVKLKHPETRYLPFCNPFVPTFIEKTITSLDNTHEFSPLRPPDDGTAIYDTTNLLAYQNIITVFYYWKQQLYQLTSYSSGAFWALSHWLFKIVRRNMSG